MFAVNNKNYYVVRNAAWARSRNTWKLTTINLMNQWNIHKTKQIIYKIFIELYSLFWPWGLFSNSINEIINQVFLERLIRC